MPHNLPLVTSSDSAAYLRVEQDGGAVVERSILGGGVRVLTEYMPGLRSATFGAWVGVGSRDELPIHAGSTHFLEHLLFKGTQRRSALDIATAFDAVGGESNALTAKEHTCYYSRTVDTDLPMAIDVILDMVTSARIDQAEFDMERGVILEELAMNDDDPTDVVHERLTEAVFGDHPLGRPIGGTPDIIKAVSREAVWEHYQQHYVPEGLVITAAGGVSHQEVCRAVLEALSAGGWDVSRDASPLSRRDAHAHVTFAKPSSLHLERPIEQTHVAIGLEGFKINDRRRAVLGVYSTILGGGMSSRLFQEIREKRGMAYSVYSFGSPYAESGLYGMYAACNPQNANDVSELMLAELARMAQDVTQEEVDRAIGQLSGATALRLEDSYSRMSRLGRAELHFGELWSMDESLAEVRAVSVEDVRAFAADIAGRASTEVRVGPKNS